MTSFVGSETTQRRDQRLNAAVPASCRHCPTTRRSPKGNNPLSPWRSHPYRLVPLTPAPIVGLTARCTGSADCGHRCCQQPCWRQAPTRLRLCGSHYCQQQQVEPSAQHNHGAAELPFFLQCVLHSRVRLCPYLMKSQEASKKSRGVPSTFDHQQYRFNAQHRLL